MENLCGWKNVAEFSLERNISNPVVKFVKFPIKRW